MSGKSLIDKYCPSVILPYAHLARWDRPIGTWLVLFPALWALILSSSGLHNVGLTYDVVELKLLPSPPLYIGPTYDIALLELFLIFIAGAFLIRGAGCTVNDIWDKKIDKHVKRTVNRPLPSGLVSTKQAVIFAALQFLLGFILLLQLNTLTIFLGIISVIPICLYPLMKRVTWWPQMVLGLVFNWGVVMGWAASTGTLSISAILMYIACIFWTLGYDTIYAHQDKEDDARLGMKSTALLFKQNSKYWVTGFYTMTVIFLGLAIWFTSGDRALFVLIPAIHLIWQVKTWKIDEPDSCLRIFKSNKTMGWLVLLLLLI